MGSKGKIAAGVLLAAVFLLAYRMWPVRLEEENVKGEAGSLANRVIVVDGESGGFGGAGSQTAIFLTRWLAGAGAMVLLSGDLDPALAATGPGTDADALAAMARRRDVPADLLVAIRPGSAGGGSWRIAYSAGEERLAADIAREAALALGAGSPLLSAAASSAVPWVQITAPPLDRRGQDNLAWAVYAGMVRYFASLAPPVNGKVLETLERDVPATVDSQ